MTAADRIHRSVVFYCPDTHIQYDGRTPYEVGVGGGVTARVRMAKALAKIGHRVTMVVNCSKSETIDGVQYLLLREATTLEGDVLILNTSGGGLDLTPVQRLPIRSSLVIFWASGTERPGGLDGLPIECIYATSNFLRDEITASWDMADVPTFVVYNGYEEDMFQKAEARGLVRDPFRIAYISHPSKGLDAAVGVLRRLREFDSRYELHVCGGYPLWGEPDRPVDYEPGLVWRGLLGQRELPEVLLTSSFALHLQNRLEPFGISLLESLRAGCVTLASPVGAYPELVEHGVNGYLIPGDPNSGSVQDVVVERIFECGRSSGEMEDIRRVARSVPWSMETIAMTWAAHWVLLSEGRLGMDGEAGGCDACGGALALLPDGLHCKSCGEYSQESAGVVTQDPESVHLRLHD